MDRRGMVVSLALTALLVVSCSSESPAANAQALSETFTQGALTVRYPADWHMRAVNPTFTEVTPSTATGSPLVFSDSEPADWEDAAGPSQIWFVVNGPTDAGPLDFESVAKAFTSRDEATDVQQESRTIAGQDAKMLTWTTTKASGMPPGLRFGVTAFEVGGQRYAVAWANSPDADPDGTQIESMLDAIDISPS